MNNKDIYHKIYDENGNLDSMDHYVHAIKTHEYIYLPRSTGFYYSKVGKEKFDSLMGKEFRLTDKSGKTTTVTMSPSGVMAGAHLRGLYSVVDLLKEASLQDGYYRVTLQTQHYDEIDTPITKYLTLGGGFQLPVEATLSSTPSPALVPNSNSTSGLDWLDGVETIPGHQIPEGYRALKLPNKVGNIQFVVLSEWNAYFVDDQGAVKGAMIKRRDGEDEGAFRKRVHDQLVSTTATPAPASGSVSSLAQRIWDTLSETEFTVRVLPNGDILKASRYNAYLFSAGTSVEDVEKLQDDKLKAKKENMTGVGDLDKFLKSQVDRQ